MTEETEVQETETTEAPAGSESEEQSLESSGEGSQTGFTLASLQGRDEGQIERYVATLEGAVKEQGSRLTVAEAKLAKEAEAPAAPAEPRKGFWEDPEDYLRRDRDELLGEMKEMVSPFYSDLSDSKEQRARDQMRTEFGSEWEQYEPIVNTLIAEGAAMGINPADPQMLRTLFYTAKGYMTHSGTPTTTAPPEPASKPSIPQHRPSGAPLPNEGRKEPELRELTENERRLARESGMTHEEYLRWQEMDETEVIKVELNDA